jgi:hypothetical protein
MGEGRGQDYSCNELTEKCHPGRNVDMANLVSNDSCKIHILLIKQSIELYH